MAVMIKDDPEPVRVCGNCGVTDVGRPHTFIQCIHNLRDLLRRLAANEELNDLTVEEREFVSAIKPDFTYQSKRTRKNELATGQKPTGNEESGGD